jgi:hypothetical protein
MLAVIAASMKFFRVVSCFLLFKKNLSVTSFNEVLQTSRLETAQFSVVTCKIRDFDYINNFADKVELSSAGE